MAQQATRGTTTAWLVALLIGCAHRPPESELVDVPAMLHVVGSVVRAIPAPGPEACVASQALATALDVAADAAPGAALPAVDLDISGCGVLLDGVPVPDDVTRAVDGGLALVALTTSAVRDPCTRAWLGDVAAWLRSAAPAVIDEISHPDGIVDLDAIALNTEACR